jgi:hypothetical protein
MVNLDELERQRAANRERQRRRREQGSQEERHIQNERGRRLNYQLSVIAKERHVEKEAVCHRKEEEMSDTQIIIIIIKYS